ncbi:hypothetical protein [Spirosoma fluviale]|uniref:Uncharacterized protein n=1 Tax=Spirosoma fluviale TaxID=1597977 RepID=A0A286GQK7_9BACT|nr:hypothetical protein [Spirosoma fluviale]SOD97800.1 hypothetical protein SAMN06269250_5925 [Spirosoma fluviale]
MVKRKTKDKTKRAGFPDFSYGEASFGTNRGISMGGGGFGKKTYTFEPDPHDDPWYNNGNQGEFYWQAAQAIIDGALGSGEWPKKGQVVVNKTTYTLGSR